MKKVSIYELERRIRSRANRQPRNSRTATLLKKGMPKTAQKFGEEAFELSIAAIQRNKKAVIRESADVFYHLLLVLKKSGVKLKDIERELALRANGLAGNPKANRRGT